MCQHAHNKAATKDVDRNTNSAIEPQPDKIDALTDDELETIWEIACNGQSGRITKYEIRLLVECYRKHAKQG